MGLFAGRDTRRDSALVMVLVGLLMVANAGSATTPAFQKSELRVRRGADIVDAVSVEALTTMGLNVAGDIRMIRAVAMAFVGPEMAASAQRAI